MGSYLIAEPGLAVMRTRLPRGSFQPLPYGERVRIGGATVSLHPAGHILGSAQVRVEVDGEVWVVTGDYKTEPDPSCHAYEPVKCHGMVTECTFGLPIFHWPDAGSERTRIQQWWARNQAANRPSILLGYSLGKAQRLLAGLDAGQGPIVAHHSVAAFCEAYRWAGISLPAYATPDSMDRGFPVGQSIFVAPPGTEKAGISARFRGAAVAFASGWAALSWGKRNLDEGFVVSDHVDWNSLLGAIDASGAQEVWTTHGQTEVVSRWLNEHGIKSRPLEGGGRTDEAE